MVKLQIYMAPIFCMAAGLGAAWLATRLAAGRAKKVAPPAAGAAKSRPAGEPAMFRTLVSAGGNLGLAAILLLLACVAGGSIARDFWSPTKSQSIQRARDFARWFWFTSEQDGEVACLKTDLDKTFSPQSYREGLSAMYLCNQRIYSPRHAAGKQYQPELVTAEHPLRCVEYYTAKFPYDSAAQAAWLGEMQARYDLVGRERYPFMLFDKHDRQQRDLDYLEVYKFVPKP
jgi:hypothetical protein